MIVIIILLFAILLCMFAGGKRFVGIVLVGIPFLLVFGLLGILATGMVASKMGW